MKCIFLQGEASTIDVLSIYLLAFLLPFPYIADFIGPGVTSACLFPSRPWQVGLMTELSGLASLRSGLHLYELATNVQLGSSWMS